MTRHERKLLQRQRFAELEAISRRSKAELEARKDEERKAFEAWRATHPVSSGLIPLIDYIPPRGNYTPA